MVFIISILATVYLAWSATALLMIIDSLLYSPNFVHVFIITLTELSQLLEHFAKICLAKPQKVFKSVVNATTKLMIF